MAKKFYAVRKGHKTGIFETWTECKLSTDGFSGADYKSFGSIEDAQTYMNFEDVSEKNKANTFKSAIEHNGLIAYVDGSYNENINRYAFGCIIITPNKEIIKESGYGDEPDAIAIHNVAGELLGALFAAKWAIKNGYKNIEIRHDLEGTQKWATGEWKAKNKITKIYFDEINKLEQSVDIIFTKVKAHSNDPFNDEADKLAKEALTAEKKVKINKGDCWFIAEDIELKSLKVIFDLMIEEIPIIQIQEIDIPYGKRFELIIPKQESIKQERLIVQHYSNNKLTIQGKPQGLFSIIVTYITELVDVEKIPELFNSCFKLDISKENIKTEFKSYLPNTFGKLPENSKLSRVLHQAVYNLNICGDLFEATFIAEPALRALEGHLKLILINNHINLKERPEDKKDTFWMFNKNGSKFTLKPECSSSIDASIKIYIEKCYSFYYYNRHTLSHWDNPAEVVDTTRMTNNAHDAHVIIKSTLSLIDEYYKMI